MSTRVLLFLLISCLGNLLSAQVLYNEEFDTAGEGVTGPQPATVITPTGPWSVSGDFTGMVAADDFFLTTTVSGEGLLEAQDTEGRVCFESDPIDISAYAMVTVSADISEIGDHESSDFVDFILVLDGTEVPVTNFAGLGNSDHALIGDLPDDSDFGQVTLTANGSGNSLVVKICVQNNAATENIRIENVLVEVAPPPVETPDIIISEINYNPIEAGTDQTEFIELYNAEAAAVDLSGYEVVGVEYTFPAGASIEAGAYLILAGNAVEFENFYGCAPDFEWGGGALSNNGEDVAVLDADGNEVDFVEYNDASPWPTEPDGDGPSLELLDLTADNSVAGFWAASLIDGGTPGAANQGSDTRCSLLPSASFTLIDALTDQPIPGFDPIPDGANIDFSAIGTALINFRYNDVDGAESVEMRLSRGGRQVHRIENRAPFALFGNNRDDYFLPTTSFYRLLLFTQAGPLTLEATPYSQDQAGGTAGTTASVNFTISVGPFNLREAALEDEVKMSIYPNPNNGNMLITGESNNANQRYNLSIYSTLGQLIYQKEVGGNFTQKLALGFLGNGLYFVKLESDNFQKTERLIIQH
ncbi:MAG: lamin tail domain-containing protein [Bacteroidota bacterium]